MFRLRRNGRGFPLHGKAESVVIAILLLAMIAATSVAAGLVVYRLVSAMPLH